VLARLPNRFACNFPGKRDRTFQQVAVDQAINDPACLRVFRTNGISLGTHRNSFRNACKSWQALRSSSARNYAELDFGLTNLRDWSRDAIVSCHGQLQAAAKCGSVYCHDHGLPAVLDLEQYRLESVAASSFAGCHLAEFLDVRSRNESAAGTNHHRGHHVVVPADLFYYAGDAFRHARAQRVYRRVIDCDDRDVALLCQANQVAHVGSPCRDLF
jgi:hypothetical protein